MTKIYIDTQELRGIADSLRDGCGEVDQLLRDLGGGFNGTRMPFGVLHVKKQIELHVHLSILKNRVGNDANSLDIEAKAVETAEAVDNFVADLMGGVRWVLGKLDDLWDWTAPLRRTLADIATFVAYAAALVVVWKIIFPLVGEIWAILETDYAPLAWFNRGLVRHHKNDICLAQPPSKAPLGPNQKPINPPTETTQVAWDNWRKRLEDGPTSYANYMRAVGTMPVGAVVVINVSDICPARWVVLLRGIDPDLPDNSFNSRGNSVGSHAFGWGAYEEAITKAVTAAGVKEGDGLMMIGHSQGGIAARNLAADSDFTHRYNVEGVVTAGSPVRNGYAVVDPDTHTVSLANAWDPVAYAPSARIEGLQRGTEVDHNFGRKYSTDEGDKSFLDVSLEPHDIDYYADELEHLSGEGSNTAAGRELAGPPFSNYSGTRTVSGGAKVIEAHKCQ
ncbi:MAG: hypothetical protein EXQ69_03360 [Acidimicrobiia bacterium]|nr:hypothetical protein [Acidimicrobiia bacterium]